MLAEIREKPLFNSVFPAAMEVRSDSSPRNLYPINEQERDYQ